MSKIQTVIALALVLTACGSNDSVTPDTTSSIETTGGSASTLTTSTTQMVGSTSGSSSKATGGSSSKATGGSSANVAGTSSVLGTSETGGNQPLATGGSAPQGTTSTGGSSSVSTTKPMTTGGNHSTGGSSSGTGGSTPKATGGSSTLSSSSTGGSNPSTGGSKATGGSNPGTGGSTPKATGGNPSTGGSSTVTATGGSAPQATGGSPSTGGSSTVTATGGSAPQATGGSSAQATGGNHSTGGSSAQATGGSAPVVQPLYQGISVPGGTYPNSESHGIIRTDSSNLYWSTYRSLSSDLSIFTSIIRKMPKTGGTPTTIVTAPSGSYVGDLVVNGGYIYWMESIKSTGQVKINKALVDGTSASTLTTISSPYAGSTRPILLTLRTDGTYLFWVGTPVIQYDTNGYANDTTTRIDMISVNGGAVSTLISLPGPTWDVTLGGDTSVICYEMIINGVFVLNSTSWYADSRPSIQCSSPSNHQIAYGDMPSFATFESHILTTYAASHAYFPNQYGIADELHYSSTDTLLTEASALGEQGYMESDASDLFYASNGTIRQVNTTTLVDQPLTNAVNPNSMTSDGTTLFWVDGVNIYSIPKL